MSQGRRVREAAVAAVLAATAFHQAPGLTVSDTKMDLTQAPVAFLLRSLRLWEPTVGFGQLQNQAYGYLWPMGSFFLAGKLLAVPAWIIQRLWWALVMSVAFTGVVRLADRLGIGTPWARLIAGVAFALSPRMLTGMVTCRSPTWTSWRSWYRRRPPATAARNASLRVPPARWAASFSGAFGTSSTPRRRTSLRRVIRGEPVWLIGRTMR